ncbi:flagellar filament capping protein FliD [Limnobacter humi]|uniref:Flagellar hook-associated protein 2 n=1 Tax=Limnobacter humi TaxID=1778671 RepID=A0ABT1WJ48_9BURK|nr:flagellar filament capping protein FliD [Limnobacter humi]MCQ8897529.1 flagellar filament capping protein FliD [Limnobacter humi]
MGITANGLGSGLDINGIVGQLVNLERAKFAPKTQQQADYKDRISQFGLIKSNLASLQDAAKKIRELAAGTQKTQNTNPEIVTPTLVNGTNNTYTVKVNQLATKQLVQTTGYNAGKLTTGVAASTQGTLRFTFGALASNANGVADADTGRAFTSDGTTVDLALTANASGEYNLSDIAAAINADTTLKTRISARVDDVIGTPNKRLVIESKGTGTAQAFQIGDAGGAPTNGLEALLFDPAVGSAGDVTQVSAAKDAKAVVNGNIGVASSSNQFNNAVAGLSFAALKVDAATATITGTFGVDNAAVKSKIADFITTYNKTVGNLKANQDKDAKLSSESLPGQIEQSIRRVLAAGADVGGTQKYLSDLGIKIDKTGLMVLDDSAKLDALVASDPNGAVNILGSTSSGNTGLLSNLDKVLKDLTGIAGPLAQRSDSLNAAIRRIDNDRIQFNKRVDRIQERLFKQFSALDASISSLQSSQNLLTQRLGALQQQQQG